MERIESLRKLPFEEGVFSDRFFYLFHKEYERLRDLNEWERYGKAFYAAFAGQTPSISRGELIVGKRDVPFTPEEKAEWEQVIFPIANARRIRAGQGQDSHMTVDYDLLLKCGIDGVIQKIDGYLAGCEEEQKPFYNCCKLCLLAVVKHAENYADHALSLAEETENPAWKAELLQIGEICRKVPAKPAKTFYEALQSVHFLSYCLSLNPIRLTPQQFQLGHPDRYLLPYYEKDLAEGKITKEYAQLLLDCLGVQINLRVPRGLSSGYMVGGRDEKGNLVSNDLTDMCMQVIDDIRLVYPAVGLCVAEGMPGHHLEKACKILANGRSHPAIFNDDLIVKGLMHYGVPEKQARNYIHSTCVEITPEASSNAWVASPYTNVMQILLDVMDREYDTLDDLIGAYHNALDSKIKADFEDKCYWRHHRAENSLNPLLSCFVNDCLARGKDIEQGGAIYNWIMPSFVGMGNLVDSVYAIGRLVFEEKRLTIRRFKEILEQNYEGNEPLRQYILNQIPKYGNDIDDVDRLYSRFTEHIVAECEKYQGVFTNAQIIPSVFCYVRHETFGTQTMATPDGRVAGFPLGDGSGPCQGREMNGPTASILSSTKWDHSKFIGGVAVNMRFTKAALGPDSLKVMETLLRTFIQRGGFEMQINVVDNDTLKKAQKDPESYRDLVVRIGGYSDYFVNLSPEMQAEVILRTAHNV